MKANREVLLVIFALALSIPAFLYVVRNQGVVVKVNAEIKELIDKRGQSQKVGSNAASSLSVDKGGGIKWLPTMDVFEPTDNDVYTGYSFTLGEIIVRRKVKGGIYGAILGSPDDKVISTFDLTDSFPHESHFTQIIGPSSLLCSSGAAFSTIASNYEIRAASVELIEKFLASIPPEIVSKSDPTMPAQREFDITKVFSLAPSLRWLELVPKKNGKVAPWFPVIFDTVVFTCYLGMDSVTGETPIAIFPGSPTSVISVKLNDGVDLSRLHSQLEQLSSAVIKGSVQSSFLGEPIKSLAK